MSGGVGLRTVGLAALVTLVLVLAVPSLPSALTAPSAASPGPLPAVSVATQSAPASTATPSASPSASPSAPPSAQCQTPYTDNPVWLGGSFFRDVQVTIQVPGWPSMSGTNYNVLPCANDLPTYLAGFWVNVTTNVNISNAWLTIWGVEWQTASESSPPDIAGYTSASPALQPMYINSGTVDGFHTASGYVNVYKAFWPGDTVWFNITMQSTVGQPSTIYSAAAGTMYAVQRPAGFPNLATWSFNVDSPFWSNNFSNDILVTTTPSIFGSPAYYPNLNQSLLVTIYGLTSAGTLGGPIPEAQLNLVLKGQYSGTFGYTFGAINHTVQTLPEESGIRGIGPYPGTIATFNISAWLPWQGGAIDYISSPEYTLTWNSSGDWPSPTGGLGANAIITTSPSGIFGQQGTLLPTDTPVNLSIVVPAQNVTISAAYVRYTYTNPSAGGSLSGNLPMTLLPSWSDSQWKNSSVVTLPGLPPGGTLSFSLLVLNGDGAAATTGVSSYTEVNNLVTNPPSTGFGVLFLHVVDLSTGQLVNDFPYAIQGNGVSTEQTATALGFAAPLAASGSAPLLLPAGTYSVTVWAMGHVWTFPVPVAGGQYTTALVNGASQPLSGTATVSVQPVTIALVAGVIGATALTWPLYVWYAARRKRADEEQRRITL